MASYWQLILILSICLPGVGDRAARPGQAPYPRALRWFNHADFESARSAAEDGYRASCRRPESPDCWNFRLLLAESLIELDRIKEALPLIESSAPSSELEARRLSDRAQAYLRKNDEVQVLQCLERAGELVPSAARDLAGKIEVIRGSLQMQNGQLPEAEISFRRALTAVEGSQSPIESYTLSDLGFLNLHRFRYDEALYWFGRARDLAEHNGMQRARYLAIANMGAAFLSLGDLERAIKNLDIAVALAEASHDRVYQMRFLVLLGETWFASGDLTKAAECYQRARALGSPDRDKEWLADVLDDLSRIALRKGDLAAAEDLNNQGMALAQQLKTSQSLLTHQIQSAAISAARHQYAPAEQAYILALAASQTAGDPVAAFRCRVALASLYRETGGQAKAEQEYQAVILLTDAERAKLRQDESKFSFVSSLIEFYRDYVDFLIDRGDTAGAFRVAESCRARVLEEKLHREGHESPAADWKSLQHEAKLSGSILLSYWLAPRRSLLWVIDSNGLRQFSLPPEDEIAAHVRRYNDAIQRGDNPAQNGDAAGQWLFANLLGGDHRLPNGRNVVIEPDGILHQLNFESLPAETGNRYWIEDATVSVAPSLALLRQSKIEAPHRLLVIGDPGYDGTEFRPLTNVKAELEAVEKHFPTEDIYAPAGPTPAAYRGSHPETYSNLHFAAHAVANRESPLDSAIVLAGSPDSRKLYAREILLQPLTADLVTLSACQTAGSRTYYGEGFTGFSWAFLSAGARNVVAGLWNVDDRTTAVLMKKFYDELSKGESPAAALRTAKREMMTLGGANGKPLYWAAFQTFTKALYHDRAGVY